jgi:DNA-binding MarR family transcriptional regulator
MPTKLSTNFPTKLDLAQLPSYAGYQIRQAQLAVFQDISARLKPLGVTPGEFSLLTLIGANPGLSQADLVVTYDLDKSTLSHAVKGLTKRQLVLRFKAGHDRRVNLLKLTGLGSEVLAGARREIERQETVMKAVLNHGEQAQLLDMLTRISAALHGRGA